MDLTKEQELAVAFEMADFTGKQAANTCKPTPMSVSDGVNDWYIPEGVCGFAWINIHPANCAAAKFAKKYYNARKNYSGGGVCIWVSDYNQSMELKEAYAEAFANVLRINGIDARAGSRMD